MQPAIAGDYREGVKVSGDALTFTAANWNIAQTVTVVRGGAYVPTTRLTIANRVIASEDATCAGLAAPPIAVHVSMTSHLVESRRVAEEAILLRSAEYFSRLTSRMSASCLDGTRQTAQLDAIASGEARRGRAELSLGFAEGWSSWSGIEYANYGGTSGGTGWSLFAGADALSDDGHSVFGFMAGYSPSSLRTTDGATIESRHRHIAFYGAERTGEGLTFGMAIGLGRGLSDLSREVESRGTVKATYASRQFMAQRVYGEFRLGLGRAESRAAGRPDVCAGQFEGVH